MKRTLMVLNFYRNDLGGLVTAPEGPDVQRKVWGEILQKLETIQPGISKNI
jgi:hypothetical protein